MRLLFLGGTSFFGRHTVELALSRGHEVTLVHRGVTGADLFPQAERIVADRSSDLAVLRGREFDAVIDTSGQLPEDVERSAQLLRGHAGRYLFVSSRSVYADNATIGLDEDAALLEEPFDEYGPRKVRCERAVQAAFGDAATIVRPGLIVGPFDPTGRFAHWPGRIAEGGSVLCPAPPAQAVQLIDGRDLAAFVLRLVEDDRPGVFDVVTPADTLTFGAIIDVCVAQSGSDATPVWVDGQFLLDRGVEPWTEIPLWAPWPGYEGFHRSDVSRALAAGLTVRPIDETVRDTLEWLRTGPAQDGTPLTREREAQLLSEWSDIVGA